MGAQTVRVQNQYDDVNFSVHYALHMSQAFTYSICTYSKHSHTAYILYMQHFTNIFNFSVDANKNVTFHIASVRNNTNTKLEAGFN